MDARVAVALSKDDEDAIGPQGLSFRDAPWQRKNMWVDHGADATVLQARVASFRSEQDPVVVRPQVSVNAIDNIDSVAQTFSVRYTLFLGVWISREEFEQHSRDPVGFVPKFLPQFMPYNAVEVKRCEPVLNPDWSRFFTYIQHGQWMAGGFMEHTVVFSTPMDLRAFPFDTQTLVMQWEIRDNQQSWSLERPKFEIEVEAYYGGDSASFQNIFTEPTADWVIKPWRKAGAQGWIVGDSFLPNEDSWGEVYRVTIATHRNWMYFMWRIVFIMAIISSTASWIFTLNDAGETLNFLAAELVAAIAFLFTVSKYLPAVSYLTLLDKYLFASFAYVFVAGTLNMAYITYRKNYGGNLDGNVRVTAGLIGFAVWVFMHVVFASVAMRRWRIERLKLAQVLRKNFEL